VQIRAEVWMELQDTRSSIQNEGGTSSVNDIAIIADMYRDNVDLM
jgi:hypothetical protein